MRNASVDEYAARKGACAQVHLPTGRMCTCRTVTGGRATSSQPTRRTRPFLFTGPTAGKGPPDDKDGSGDDAARHTVCLGADGCVGPDPIRQPPGRATCLQDLPGVLAGQLPWSPGPCQRPGPGAKRTVARRALVPASIKVSHVDTRHGLSVIAEVRDLTGGDEAAGRTSGTAQGLVDCTMSHSDGPIASQMGLRTRPAARVPCRAARDPVYEQVKSHPARQVEDVRWRTWNRRRVLWTSCGRSVGNARSAGTAAALRP